MMVGGWARAKECQMTNNPVRVRRAAAGDVDAFVADLDELTKTTNIEHPTSNIQ